MARGKKETGKKPRRGQPLPQKEWDRRASVAEIAWLEPVRRSTIKTKARCLKCGREYLANPQSVSLGHGCEACARARKRLSEEAWQKRAKTYDFRFIEIPQNRQEKVLVECLHCQYQWRRLPPHAKKKGSRGVCPVCAWASVDEREKLRALEDKPLHKSRRKDLDERRPKDGFFPTQEEWDKRAAEVGLKWLEPVEKSAKATRVLCLQCGLESEKRPGSVAFGGGCRYCKARGFNAEEPGVLYFLEIPADGIAKIGLTHTRDDYRLRHHASRGFEVRKLWRLEIGQDAWILEQNVLLFWRKGLRIKPALRDVDGWNETAKLSPEDFQETEAFILRQAKERGIRIKEIDRSDIPKYQRGPRRKTTS